MTIVRQTIPEQVVENRRLGRHISHDSRSWRYPAPMAEKIETVRHEFWGLPLDQGEVGSCTGNAMAGMLNTGVFFKSRGKPDQDTVLMDEQDALDFYSEATHLDHYKGLYPPDDTGSSGLAVCKAAVKHGFLTGYAHCFSFDHFLRTLTLQPTIAGMNWYSGFDNPDSEGIVRKTGEVRGGHEFLQIGLDAERELVLCMNSWGSGWGVGGQFYVPFSDFDALRKEQGDIKTGIL